MTDIIPLLPLHPVARESLADQVYRQLRDGLMSGRFAPGQRLTIRGLAEALGASPMPVREALRRLQAEGAFTFTETARLSVVRLSPDQLRDVRDGRVALEGLLAERAAMRMTPRDDHEIRRLHDNIQTAVDAGDAPAYLWANFAFHRRIYEVGNAPILLSAVENFWLLMGPCFVLVAPDAKHLRRSMDAHRRIRDALTARDMGAARAAVADDIMQAADSLSGLLERQNKARSNAMRKAPLRALSGDKTV